MTSNTTERSQFQGDLGKLREGIDLANVPTLLMVLVQLTGETKWLDEPYRPTRVTGLDDNDSGQLPLAIQREIRDAAFEAIVAWRKGSPIALDDCADELLVRMLSVAMDEEIPPDYGAMIANELFGREPAGTSHSGTRRTEPPAGFKVIIIGAGVSGLCTAVRLREAGVPFQILEKNAEVGGTWFENRYPGCGVDTPSHLYSYSFGENDWSHYFALQGDILEYLRKVAAEFDLLKDIQFETKVDRLVWNEQDQVWSVQITRAGRESETLEVNAVVSAVGALTKPKWPSIPGIEQFAGELIHTADWPADADLRGKRVSVIGTGASSMQLVPAVVDDVAALSIYQRSPQWAAPFEKFHAPIPEPVRYLMQQVPLYVRWYRLRLIWTFNDRIYDSLQRDPDWHDPEHSVSEVNDRHRQYFTRYIEQQLAARPDLLPVVLPTYPPFGKRMLMDNGWFKALCDPRVQLITDPIVAITKNGVVTQSSEIDADVLICATGFDASHFLHSLEVLGVDGVVLRDTWGVDDPRAYLGTTVPGYPNLFIQYGPNRQLGHGGSGTQMAEMNAAYTASLLIQMFQGGISSVDCREDVFDAYNQRVDDGHDHMIWSHRGFDTYYRNSKGRVVVPSPFRAVDWWNTSREANLSDFNRIDAKSVTPHH